MIREDLAEVFQNKNAIMFITTITFMGGILSYFNNLAIPASIFLTLLAVLT